MLALTFGLALLIFSSCIDRLGKEKVKYEVNVKVIPSDVISPFQFEMNTGDLTVIDNGYKIRVTLRAYDASGFLADKQSSFIQNYDAICNMTLLLESGSYTLIATTDIVEYDGSKVKFEFWNFGKDGGSNDDSKLSELEITDNGKIGSSGSKILGVAYSRVSVNDEATDTSIRVEPAGSLVLLVFNNIHADSKKQTLEVETNKLGDFLFFENSGNYSVSYKWPDEDHYFRIQSIELSDYSKYDLVYSYVFFLPGDKYEFKARYNTEKSHGYLVDESITARIGKGEEYLMMYDCKDEDTGKPLFGMVKIEDTKSGIYYKFDALKTCARVSQASDNDSE